MTFLFEIKELPVTGRDLAAFRGKLGMTQGHFAAECNIPLLRLQELEASESDISGVIGTEINITAPDKVYERGDRVLASAGTMVGR